MKSLTKYIKVGLLVGGTSLLSPAHALVATYLAPGWNATDFLTLATATRSIEFDATGNLYIEDVSDDGRGAVSILKLEASSAYTSISNFVSYATGYDGVTGLDFDGLGNLYVSERAASGDAGVIRKINAAIPELVGDVRTFNHHRPTGVDADTEGNVYYTGRRESDGTFGNVYRIDSAGERTILLENVVGTGIALDDVGHVFISTPGKDGLSLEKNSIYMFDPSNSINAERIATFDETGGELTFDDAGNLYMIDNIDHTKMIKLSLVPLPQTAWLFISGLSLLIFSSNRKRRMTT